MSDRTAGQSEREREARVLLVQAREVLRRQTTRGTDWPFGRPEPIAHGLADEIDAYLAAVSPVGVERVTHGRHCSCSACARQDWTLAELGPCGMHGPSCPREYAPIGPAGSPVSVEGEDERNRWIRLFNRLEAAVARHRKSPLFKTEADEALYAAHDKTLAEAASPSSPTGGERVKAISDGIDTLRRLGLLRPEDANAARAALAEIPQPPLPPSSPTGPTDAEIERAAKAIIERENRAEGERWDDFLPDALELQEAREDARAALTAAREREAGIRCEVCGGKITAARGSDSDDG